MPRASAYQRLVAEQRRPGLERYGAPLDRLELVRLATLAASSHNTQPWRFRLHGRGIAILPDFGRRCPAVDPDDAHLYRSLGCAAENLVHAAAAQGHAAHVVYDPALPQLHVVFERSAAIRAGALFPAIVTRQCTRLPFEPRPIDRACRQALAAAGQSADAGVYTLIVDDERLRATLTELVREGNRIQFADRDFRRELVRWLRFDDADAVRHGDGLFSRCAGRPALPGWLARPLAGLLVTARAQIRADERNLRSTPLLAVIVARRDAPATWVEAGRVCQRLLLQAAALDLRCAFVNPPIEVRALRPQVERCLGLHDDFAQLMLRIGHGPCAPYSLRRPLLDVIERDAA